MSTYSKLYWLTRLDGLGHLFGTIAILSFLCMVGILIFCLISASDDEFSWNKDKMQERKLYRTKVKGLYKYFIPSFFISFLLCILTPTKNEAIFIVAGGKTIDWIQSDTSTVKIPAQTSKIISDFLEKQITEMKDKK